MDEALAQRSQSTGSSLRGLVGHALLMIANKDETAVQCFVGALVVSILFALHAESLLIFHEYLTTTNF